jgi:RNA polymerase sigma-70 factor (ECF subfamily)
VKIFKRIGQFSGSGSFEGWLKRIVINTAITNYRQNLKRYNQVPVDFLPEDEKEVSSDDFEYTYEELLKVVQSLPTGYRMVFNLFAIEGYQHKEIAEMLEIDVATSKSQYSRARKLLQKKLVDLKMRNLIAETK